MARVALRHAEELSRTCDITLISDSLPRESSYARHRIRAAQFGFLRRLAHVPNEIAFALSARRALSELHRERPIDFVMTHSHAVAYLSAWPLRKKAGVKFGLVTHGDPFDRPAGTYDKRLTRFYQFVAPRAYRTADVIFALSPYMAECALARGGEAGRIAVIPNGVDGSELGTDAEANPLQTTGREGRLRLLYVGRLSVEKGVGCLIDACSLLRDRAVPFLLEIIGSGPLQETLRRRADELSLGDHVHFLGAQPRSSLGRFYSAADLVCVPSLSEPLAGVVLEALASGAPVMASNVGGNPSMVRDGDNGFLVPAAQPQLWADAIERLSTNRTLLADVRSRARSSVLPSFEWRTIGSQYRDRILQECERCAERSR